MDYNKAMRNLLLEDCLRLRDELRMSIPMAEALSKSVGETQVMDGVWRFFSTHYPKGGVNEWNSSAEWKREWEFSPTLYHAFGEDLFGNQLILRSNFENVYLWNHEDGSVVDLLLDPATLLEAVAQSGINWIDFYNDGSLKIAQARLMDVPAECHLHWTTPLILGGKVNVENTTVVERSMHLVGHAKLWRQLRGCSPGTIIIPTRKPNS
jgi:hypothetical protein